MDILGELAAESGMFDKIRQTFNFEKLNCTEGRSVFHVGLRMTASDNPDVTKAINDVTAVNAQVKAFADKVRSGEVKSVTGENFKTFLVIGIGGSVLGCEFINEALSL